MTEQITAAQLRGLSRYGWVPHDCMTFFGKAADALDKEAAKAEEAEVARLQLIMEMTVMQVKFSEVLAEAVAIARGALAGWEGLQEDLALNTGHPCYEDREITALRARLNALTGEEG